MNKKQQSMLSLLAGIFFLSGISALIYQVSWQRLLFTGFGVDLTSITIIVSIFMVGLGLGGFFGGRIADAAPKNNIKVFAAIEFLIAIFGLLSIKSIECMQRLVINQDLWVSSIAIFALLLIPTFLMGATLPILTAHFNKAIKNIGSSIGILYFTNTAGAAFGAILTAFCLFGAIGLEKTIYVAAGINLFIALTAIALSRGAK